LGHGAVATLPTMKLKPQLPQVTRGEGGSGTGGGGGGAVEIGPAAARTSFTVPHAGQA
jgi:hypothetical protein